MSSLIEFNRNLRGSVQENNIRNIATNLYLINPSFIFFNDNDRRDVLYSIYTTVCNKFSIPITSLYLTGSAHVGFSLKNNNEFSSKSDLDLSIIDNIFFNRILNNILDESNLYQKTDIFKDLPTLNSYKNNLCKGKIHPLYFPNGETKKDWDSFFQSLSRDYKKYFSKITACVYISEECFRSAQEESLSRFSTAISE